jgi:hypothetical protein
VLARTATAGDVQMPPSMGNDLYKTRKEENEGMPGLVVMDCVVVGCLGQAEYARI